MKGTLLRVTLVVLLVGALASTADAQRRPRRRSVASAGPRYGAHLGYNFDADALLLGAQVSWPVSPRVDIYPSFDYYFVDPGSLWALNFDLKFRPPTRYGAWYLGGGLNLLHNSGSDTNLGLFTGLEARRGGTRPYVEARFILGDGSSFQIVGGFSVR